MLTALIWFLIYLCVLGLVVWLILFVIRTVPILPPWLKQIVEVVVYVVALIVVLLMVLKLFSGIAIAHHAPSGWKYPEICCSNVDCHQIDCQSELTWTENGWVIKASGELVAFDKTMISGDNHCHRCFRVLSYTLEYNSKKCLYLPAPEQ